MTDGANAVSIPGVVVDDIPHATTPPSPSVPAPSDTSAPSVEPSSSPAPASAAQPATGDGNASNTSASAATAEKKPSTPRGGAMAAGGQPLGTPGAPPSRPTWPGPLNGDEMYVPEEFDVSDLMEVNRELNRARARLFRVSQALKLAQRTLAEAQLDYDRALRRELVSISGGTSESRKAMAEIRCEGFENRIIVGKQVVDEWKKRAVDVRDDLKAIENIAHNVRAQIDIR